MALLLRVVKQGRRMAVVAQSGGRGLSMAREIAKAPSAGAAGGDLVPLDLVPKLLRFVCPQPGGAAAPLVAGAMATTTTTATAMAGAAKGAAFPRSGAVAKLDLVVVEKELFGSAAIAGAMATPTKGAKGDGPGPLVTLDLVPKKLLFDPLPGAGGSAVVGGANKAGVAVGESPTNKMKVVISSPLPVKNAAPIRLYGTSRGGWPCQAPPEAWEDLERILVNMKQSQESLKAAINDHTTRSFIALKRWAFEFLRSPEMANILRTFQSEAQEQFLEFTQDERVQDAKRKFALDVWNAAKSNLGDRVFSRGWWWRTDDAAANQASEKEVSAVTKN